jgi:hypothetical protein
VIRESRSTLEAGYHREIWIGRPFPDVPGNDLFGS